MNFRCQYCLDVKVPDGVSIGDATLDDVEKKISALNKQLAPYDSMYGERYFSDISFAITGLVIGYERALIEKVNVVREAICGGERPRLKALLDEMVQNSII